MCFKDPRDYFVSSDNLSQIALREEDDQEILELKLNHNYIYDSSNNKLRNPKLQATSATLLPLRKLILIGTEDGLIRTVI